MFLIAGTVLLVLCFSFAQENKSLFVKTTVILNACEDDSIVDAVVKSSFDCGKLCTENPDCRRYLFCSSTSACFLYHDGEDCAVGGNPTLCSCYKKEWGIIASHVTCPIGYYGNECQSVSKDCEDAKYQGMGSHLSGRNVGKTFIKPDPTQPAFEVKCLYSFNGGTVILSRVSYCKEENFNRSLSEYEEGFGSTYRNRWIGFTKLLAILNSSPMSSFKIQILILDGAWKSCSSYYTDFRIGNKSTGYAFSSSMYEPLINTPSCGDSMLGNLDLNGRPFSTYDSDHTGSNNCSARFGGGWWFDNSPDCTSSFLTGDIDANIWLDDLSGEKLNLVEINLLPV